MEAPRSKIDAILEELPEEAQDAGEYLQLFLDYLEDFNIPEYANDPELARFTLTSLESDQNDLMAELDDAIEAGADREVIVSALSQLAQSLKDKKVTFWALKPILKHFGIDTGPKEEGEPDQEKVIRFRMPNLLYDRVKTDEFFRACGLTEESEEGKGSHTKWKDENGKTIAYGSRSPLAWLKNTIKLMLKTGFPIERIQDACKKLKIDFRIISD